MVKFSNTTPLPLTIFGGVKKLKLTILGGSKTEPGNNIWGGLKTNWQF